MLDGIRAGDQAAGQKRAVSAWNRGGADERA